MAQRHVDLAELVWKRCRRLVALGREVLQKPNGVGERQKIERGLRGLDVRQMGKSKCLYIG